MPPSADDPQLVIVASGSEVQLSIAAAAGLDGVRTRLVSMPSWELFDKQSLQYQLEVRRDPRRRPCEHRPLLLPSPSFCRQMRAADLPARRAGARRRGCVGRGMVQVRP